VTKNLEDCVRVNK